MTVLLSIETTDRHLGVSLHALKSNGSLSILNAFFSESAFKQSEQLFPVINQVLRKARIKKNDIGMIAVDVGPGSFTGVRVGVSSARALAQGLGCPLVGVTSLEALAHQARRDRGDAERTFVCVPALPGEFYVAAYEGPREILAPRWVSADQLKILWAQTTKPPRSAVIVSPKPDVVVLSLDLKSDIRVVEIRGVHPQSLAELAVRRKVPRKKDLHYERVVPLYLQPSWAERRK